MTATKGLLGVNNDPKHQLIITFITYHLNHHFQTTKKYNKLIATPELHIDSFIPDVYVWDYVDNKHNEPIIIFEVCWKKKKDDDVKKVQKLMKDYPSIKEGFIITIEDHTFYRVRRKVKGNLPSNPFRDTVIQSVKFNMKNTLKLLS